MFVCVLVSPTKLVSLSEAGEGGIESGALLFVGTELLQQLTHLLLAHLQQTLQGHLTWAHLLKKQHDIQRHHFSDRKEREEVTDAIHGLVSVTVKVGMYVRAAKLWLKHLSVLLQLDR